MTDLPEIKKTKIELDEKTIKRLVNQIIIAICIMVYFLILNLANFHMPKDRLTQDIKVFALIFLIIGIGLIEKAYQKDDGKIGIYGVEVLVLAGYTLSIMHFVVKFKIPFQQVTILSAFAFSIYYVMKAIFIYTKAKKEFLASFSDISEIVKKEQPTKKEAVKRANKKSVAEEKQPNVEITKIETSQKEISKQENKAKKKSTKNKENKLDKKEQTSKPKTVEKKQSKKREKTKKEGK